MRKCGSREGAIGAIDPLKPSKLCLFTIILCNSEINVSDSMTLKYVIFLKSPPSPLTLPAGSCDCGPQTFTTGHAQVLLKLRTFLKLNLSIKNVDTAALIAAPPPNLTGWIRPCDCGPQTFSTGHAQVLLKLRTFLKLNLSIKNVDTAAFVLQTS